MKPLMANVRCWTRSLASIGLRLLVGGTGAFVLAMVLSDFVLRDGHEAGRCQFLDSSAWIPEFSCT